MPDPLAAKGRGAHGNPPNRFGLPIYQPDLDNLQNDSEALEALRRPATEFLPDHARTVVTENDSPDIPFRYSLNPYRGCEHGCSYCLAPDTRVLYADMTWRRIGDARPGHIIVGFDEYPPVGMSRKYRAAVVEAVWWSKQATRRLVTANAEITTTANHRWLDARNGRWCRTETFTPGRTLRRMPVAEPEAFDDDYRVGYIAGLSLGDGTIRYEPGWRSNRLGFPAAYWRVALADEEPLVRLVDYLRGCGLEANIRPFYGGPASRRVMQKVEVRSLSSLAVIHGLLRTDRDSRSYRRGFLAGFFDAEGCNSDSLRITQKDILVLERVRGYAASLGFAFRLEPREGHASTIRLVGRLHDRFRFFCVCRPAIRRKVDTLFGWQMELEADPIREIRPGAPADVVDIQTSTGTFLAAGIATHNCYARPTHEYLGLGAGLDFETKIFVKEDAPGLFRDFLCRGRWRPEPITLSGVTDCYQPAERRFRLTRGCLEVAAEAHQPITIITKNALVLRDLDLLRDLAADRLAHVALSITTLDAGLARSMEPRTSTPEAKLGAVRTLAAAGVPVLVLMAPVIPGLNDSEIPALLAAVKKAGATAAGWQMLRLPLTVAPVFLEWLRRERPDACHRVEGRIRDMRGGELNNPRFGERMHGTGELARQIGELFRLFARRHGLDGGLPPLDGTRFRPPASRSGVRRLF